MEYEWCVDVFYCVFLLESSIYISFELQGTHYIEHQVALKRLGEKRKKEFEFLLRADVSQILCCFLLVAKYI